MDPDAGSRQPPRGDSGATADVEALAPPEGSPRAALDEAAGAWLDRLDPESLTPRRVDKAREGIRALGAKPSREAADRLLRAIERPELAAIRASDGASLRTHATEALLAMGFPYALEVSPEALEQARRERKARMAGHTIVRRLAWVCTAVDAGFCAAALYSGHSAHPIASLVPTMVFVVVVLSLPGLFAASKTGCMTWLAALSFLPIAGVQAIFGAMTLAESGETGSRGFYHAAFCSVLAAILFVSAHYLEKSEAGEAEDRAEKVIPGAARVEPPKHS